MLISLTINAQNISIDSDTPKAMEVNKYIASLKQSEQTSRSRNSKSNKVEHLIKEVQPAVYVSSKGVKIYGERPINLFVDSNSLSSVSNSTINRNDIEIVTIKINSKIDLSRPIDLALFSDYPKLQYIYIISTIQTDEITINQLIKNNNIPYTILYKIDKES